jgi:predicted molibdopterin-dependent oxidoreductase YjgC
MADKIKFNLDGNSVEAEPGETIWEVAKKHGTTIPHLCHSGKKVTVQMVTVEHVWLKLMVREH